MFKFLECVDFIGIESEGALRSFARFSNRYNHGILNNKYRLIRHPVVPEIAAHKVNELGNKKNVIMAVGSWHLPVKNVRLLVATLNRVLAKHLTWSAIISGPGNSVVEKLVSKLLPNVSSRIRVFGKKDHQAVLTHLSSSKIYFFTSTSESGPIAAQEALCLGCTVVGPPDIPSTEDLCQPCFGTRPKNRSSQQMAAAVETEIFAWENQLREPTVIATKARDMYSAQAVCKQILSYLS
jgi:glycosyltransferase involved in cell wall biosynthesis